MAVALRGLLAGQGQRDQGWWQWPAALARGRRGTSASPAAAAPAPQIKCTSLSQQNARLLSHVVVLEGQKAVLARQVRARGDWAALLGGAWRAPRLCRLHHSLLPPQPRKLAARPVP